MPLAASKDLIRSRLQMIIPGVSNNVFDLDNPLACMSSGSQTLVCESGQVS